MQQFSGKKYAQKVLRFFWLHRAASMQITADGIAALMHF